MSRDRIRKQVYELRTEDLNLHAIWEFALDEEGEEGQNEATVRPFEPEGSLDPSNGMFVVRARFVLADGTQMRGYLTPPVQGDSDLGTLQPAIVTDAGQVTFWYGTLVPEPAQVAATYACLGKSLLTEVFPVRFQSDVDLIGGPVAGELPGFLVLEDFQSMRTRVIK
jgi:hypothetical protein